MIAFVQPPSHYHKLNIMIRQGLASVTRHLMTPIMATSSMAKRVIPSLSSQTSIQKVTECLLSRPIRYSFSQQSPNHNNSEENNHNKETNKNKHDKKGERNEQEEEKGEKKPNWEEWYKDFTENFWEKEDPQDPNN